MLKLKRAIAKILFALGAPLRSVIRKQLELVMYNDPVVIGSKRRFHMSKLARKNNILANTNSGEIRIEDYAFFGKNVCLLTGTHDYTCFNERRLNSAPRNGHDIIIEEGAWIATGVIIIGPTRIGRHSVIAAGSVVTGDIPPFCIAAGVPAKIIKEIPTRPDADTQDNSTIT
ncbi:acyltransferase [PVC group bacterium]|nr:acyltransferase [PVC group bacterium]